jgi:FkbM family methyltransferase
MTESTAVSSSLIYDVGMHNGDDTAFYLHQGFRVIAIEANPELADLGKRRFSSEIDSGRLTILNVGIAEKAGTGTFWICDDLTVWSSFEETLMSRVGKEHHSIEIQTRRFCEILEEYGIPFFLKVDIEGSDHLCLQDLVGKPLPQFISVEAESGANDDDSTAATGRVENLSLLYTMGYRRFKLVRQSDFKAEPESEVKEFTQRVVNSAAHGKLRLPGLSQLAKQLTSHEQLCRKYRYRFSPDSSGPWGDGAPGVWLSYEQAQSVHTKARRRYARRAWKARRAGFGHYFWYDWHAKV